MVQRSLFARQNRDTDVENSDVDMGRGWDELDHWD